MEREKYDPNFPEGGLNIQPSFARFQEQDGNLSQDSAKDIDQYGIAGRIWCVCHRQPFCRLFVFLSREAAYVLKQYLTVPAQLVKWQFDPPCSIFESTSCPVTAVELGAGVGIVGIHLAQCLAHAPSKDLKKNVILTDLENVLPLLERNVTSSRATQPSSTNIFVEPLPWGSQTHVDKLLSQWIPTHLVCSDLVYFPHLLAPLLRTLVLITDRAQQTEIIIGYKIRSYSKEEPFWRAFGAWFDFSPVYSREKASHDASWRRFGSLKSHFFANKTVQNSIDDDDVYVFLAKRKADTFSCRLPDQEEELMSGKMVRGEEIIQGNGLDTFEILLMSESAPFD